jgi:hypothetical protein
MVYFAWRLFQVMDRAVIDQTNLKVAMISNWRIRATLRPDFLRVRWSTESQWRHPAPLSSPRFVSRWS